MSLPESDVGSRPGLEQPVLGMWRISPSEASNKRRQPLFFPEMAGGPGPGEGVAVGAH